MTQLRIASLESAYLKFTSKLIYLIENQFITCGIVIHVYKDKIFLDKVDSNQHTKKYHVSFLITKVLSGELANKKVLYMSCRPNEYLFHDGRRQLLDDLSLVKWWLNFWKNWDVFGSFYITNEEPGSYQLPENIVFEKYTQYNFKEDGIDDPKKPWDEMVEYIGCFKLYFKNIIGNPIECYKLENKEFHDLIDKVRENFDSIKLFDKFEKSVQTISGFCEYVDKRIAKPEPLKRTFNANSLIKKKKKLK